MHERYKRLREVYSVEENQLQLYVTEPNALSTFIQSDGFVHTELRSVVLFVALGLIYIAKDRVIDFLAERPIVYTALRYIWLVMQNIVNVAIGEFITLKPHLINPLFSQAPGSFGFHCILSAKCLCFIRAKND